SSPLSIFPRRLRVFVRRPADSRCWLRVRNSPWCSPVAFVIVVEQVAQELLTGAAWFAGFLGLGVLVAWRVVGIDERLFRERGVVVVAICFGFVPVAVVGHSGTEFVRIGAEQFGLGRNDAFGGIESVVAHVRVDDAGLLPRGVGDRFAECGEYGVGQVVRLLSQSLCGERDVGDAPAGACRHADRLVVRPRGGFALPY